MKIPSKIAVALGCLTLALAVLAPPALARDTFIYDGAGMFSAATVASLNAKIANFNQSTGKEVVVVTVPTLNGTSLNDATEQTFAQKQVNGVLIFIAKAEKQFNVVGDRASHAFFPPGEFKTIHDAMRASFQTGDFDGGLTIGVNLILAQYQSHQRGVGAGVQQPAPARNSQSFGGFMSLILLGLVLLVGFLIIRAIFRALFGRRVPPGYGAGPGYGGPPMGGPGYGAGYGAGGYGGGGGSFFSGLLGGLGGAFLGNELFRGGNQSLGGGAGMAGMGGDQGAGVDASGWQSDAGQVDMGNAGGGGWGDSGGGFDGGGGGDFGGGGDGGGGW